MQVVMQTLLMIMKKEPGLQILIVTMAQEHFLKEQDSILKLEER